MPAANDRKRFEDFLRSVNLDGYRVQYNPIKIVEMDLDKDIHALELLYTVYWEERDFITFEQFYARYLEEKKTNLEAFRTKIQMCKKCFYKGLPARIYRTWASIITQIQGAYVAEDIFGADTVEMSEELDHKGADFRIGYKGRIFNCQVKKESFSREVRQGKKGKKKLDGKWLNIGYFVPGRDVFANHKKLNGEYKEPYKRFVADKRLKRLPNGFVIFTDELFAPLKKKIDGSK